MIDTSTKDNKTIIGIFLILLILFAFSLIGITPLHTLFGIVISKANDFFATRIFYWVILFLTWLYCIKIEKQNLLIWQDRKYRFFIFIGSILALIAAIFVSMGIISLILILLHQNKSSTKLLELIELFRANKFLLVFTALSAGITEELIFRGYLQPRLELIFKNSWVAIIITSVLFGLLHYTFGTLAQVVGPLFIGFIFAFYYSKFRNIKVLIICHFLWDLIGLFILINKHHQ